MFSQRFTADYRFKKFSNSTIIHADCFDWLRNIAPNSIHGVVTDPPYGVKEYELDQISKLEAGVGGTWRIPPSFDGNVRSPLPRFTALNDAEKIKLKLFFIEWSKLINNVLLPGGHVFVASNSFLAQILFTAIADGGLEFRGTIIRQVRTLRGGDRPKNAEQEFPDVCSLPRGCFEPWGLFRKPLESGMTVSECLRQYGTGGLRRQADGRPFEDLIMSERTSQKEREIAEHPSLKPQSLLRQLVYAVLPLGEGIILDPFMGSGSTVAAAEAMGLNAIGIERHDKYFDIASQAIPKLSALKIGQSQMVFEY